MDNTEERIGSIAEKLAFETIEDKVTVRKIRTYLLEISDFVFRHRTAKPTTMVEVSGKEIEDLKWAVQRALDLT